MNEIQDAVDGLDKAFAEFKKSNDDKHVAASKRFDEIDAALADQAIKAAAAEMRPGTAVADNTPVHAAAGLSAKQLQAYYRAKAAEANEQAHDTPTLAQFIRGVAGMKTTPAVMASLAGGTDADGGYALPSLVQLPILDALAESSALLQAGVRMLPMPEGAKSVTVPAIATLPSPAWRAELGAVAESAPTFRGVVLAPKSLACIVRISRELLADSPDVDRALRTAVAQAVAAALDTAGLVGTGTGSQPKGISGTTGINTAVQAGAKFDWADVLSGAQKIAEAKAPAPTSLIVSPRTGFGLAALKDTIGQWLGAPPALAGVKTINTVGVPNNLGSGTNESLAFIGDFSTCVFGMREQLSFALLREAYAKTGELGLLCHVRADFAAQYPAALATVTKVTS